jgi:hypothetical protein
MTRPAGLVQPNQQCPVAWTDLAWTLQCCSPRQSRASLFRWNQKRSTTGASWHHSDLQSPQSGLSLQRRCVRRLSWQRSRLPVDSSGRTPSGGSSPRLCSHRLHPVIALFMQGNVSGSKRKYEHAPCAKVAAVYHSHCSMCASECTQQCVVYTEYINFCHQAGTHGKASRKVPPQSTEPYFLHHERAHLIL